MLLCHVHSVVGFVQCGINSSKQTPDVVKCPFIGWSRIDVGLGFPTGSEGGVPTVSILQLVTLLVREHIKRPPSFLCYASVHSGPVDHIMMLGDLPCSTEWNILLQNGSNLPMGLEPRMSPQLTMVDKGLIIAQAEYHSSQVVNHGNAHFTNPVVVHVPDHFLSSFILLLLFLHLWTMVISQIFS
jgi:hypothetical protein